MKVLMIRHAIAVKRDEFAKTGKPDRLRPLTDAGIREMRRAARGLSRIAEAPDLLAASPFTRARRTAAILKDAWGKPTVKEIAPLQPDQDPREVLRWLQGCRKKRVALVGHEPHLSRLIALLCAGKPAPFTGLKKGQACMLELKGRGKRKTAKLLWSMQPSQLGRIKN